MVADISKHYANPLVNLWRYDCDQTLEFRGMKVPDGTELQFYQGVYSTRTFVSDRTATVPDYLLAQATDVIAYLYITGANGGQTVRRIIITVRDRPKPTDYADPTPPVDYSHLLPASGDDGNILMFGPEGPYWESDYDYSLVGNKPSIEDVVLEGKKTLEQLGMKRITNQELEEILQI